MVVQRTASFIYTQNGNIIFRKSETHPQFNSVSLASEFDKPIRVTKLSEKNNLI